MAAPSAMSFSLAPGEVVAGRYLIARALGRGGMGEVYEAADQLLGETVALKTLRADLARADSIVRHFQKEIQLARRVTHGNVCRVFETGLHGALPFFTMELLRGESLAARVKRRKGLPVREAYPIVVQMARGLEAAHAAGVIHADFKSGNVFLVPRAGGERAVITDFGLARVDYSSATGDETTQTMSTQGHVAGTPEYMSPEQRRGAEITAASDIYSFGIVLFEMATGELPLDGRKAPAVDARWEGAIARCLERDPAKRFAHASEIAEWFEAGTTRREWMARGAAAALVLASGAGYWVWMRRPYRPRAAALGWYQRGVAALHSMTYEAARRAFEQSVAADPGYAMAHAGLARAYEELDYADLARESMLRAVGVAQESRLSNGEDVKLRALQFLVSRDYGRAAPLFQQLETNAPVAERPAAALEAGWLAQLREDTDGAAAAYERALRLKPGYAAAKLRLGFILGRRRQVDAALRTFDEAEALYQAASDSEGVTETLYERARLLNRSSRSAEALPVIEKALGIAKAVGNPYQQISLQLAQGVAVRNMGDTARAGVLARQAIDQAVAQRMDNLATNGMIDLGNSYLTAGETRTAEPIFQRALELAGRAKVRRNEARARLALASVYEVERRPREGRPLVEAGLEFFRQAGYRRELVQASTLLGGILRQLGEFEKAAAVLREAVGAAAQLHDPLSEGNLRERLGAMLRDQGALPEAVAEFEQAGKLLGAAGGESRLDGALVAARLGRGADGVETLASQAMNRQLRAAVQVGMADIAYREGRLKDAAALLSGEPAGGRVLRELVRIRMHGANADAGAVLAEVDREGLPMESASARLALAEAMAPATGAGKLAGEALEFFESRGNYESIWRAHSVMAMSSREPVVVAAHRSAARAALSRLASLWPPADFDGYRKRRDAAALAAAIE